MGQEVSTKLRYKKRIIEGKALLETDYVLFKGAERLKVLLKDLTGVKAIDGALRLEFPGGPAEFMLGPAAEKWANKILHPPSRLDKLGVKEGVAVRLVGPLDQDFRIELSGAGAKQIDSKAKAELVFLAVDHSKQLSQVPKVLPGMETAGALWIVYPKGTSEVREIEVIQAGRAAGLKDVKVASFSKTHTGLKFVIPINARHR